MSCTKLSRGISITNKAAQLVGVRGFAIASGKGKKGPKGGPSHAPKASVISEEVKSTTVVGANILKDGTDPKIMPDSEYPDWLWCLLDKRPTLSELRRKDSESLPFEDLKRFVKLDNRAESRKTMLPELKVEVYAKGVAIVGCSLQCNRVMFRKMSFVKLHSAV